MWRRAARILLLGLLLAPALAGETPDAPRRYATEVRPILARYCYPCHGDGVDEAGLALDDWPDPGAAAADVATWRLVAARLAAGEMPPAGEPRPSAAETERVLAFARAVAAETSDRERAAPGRTTLRRLTRREIENSVRDLLGVDVDLAADLPPDDTGYGFDRIGDVLSLSPLHVEKLLAAADRALDAALELSPPFERRTRAFPGAELEATTGGTGGASGRWLWSNGEAFARVDLPVAGTYEIRVEAAAQQAGDDPAKAAVVVDGRELDRFDVKASPPETTRFSLRAELPAGERRFGVAFLNDSYRPEAPDPADRDRNLLVVRIEVDGPIGWRPPPPSASHRRIFFTTPAAAGGERVAARLVVGRFADRAFRRPAGAEATERLLTLFDAARAEGETFEAAVAVALKAALVSPRFLFLVEADAPGGPRPLDGYELASRLSYLLWSGPPDDRLRAAAASGRLLDPAVLAAETERMLDDPRADRFAFDFAGQWLGLRALDAVAPDPERFPAFTEELRRDMRRETELFFRSVVREDRSLLDLLTARDTFLNERLAALYGIPGVTGEEFRRVRLRSPERLGVLTQASILTITSNPTRTSPVKRGKWVLEQILDAAPPPPPAGVPPLPKAEGADAAATIRERMRRHRTDPKCAVCHRRMDPIGFAFENYDGIGRWRETDGADPVDARGRLPDGRSFDGVPGLARVLLDEREAFARAFVRSLLAYALGRGPGPGDAPAVDRIVLGSRGDGGPPWRFRAVLREVVTSGLFRCRQPEGGGR